MIIFNSNHICLSYSLNFLRGILKGLAAFYLAGLSMTAHADEGSDIYKKACAVCHAAGVPGIPDAPKLSTRTDPGFGENWNRRLFAGREALLRSVLDGKGAMPPKGGDASLSDRQTEAALDYMLMQMDKP
ncbi:MAG: c-type cytochrome [Gallionellaceae bacterium]|nr:c-type cytochrome [Gallionellaceae bacterium]